MKSLRIVFLALVVSLTLLLSGCALLDGLFMDPQRDAQGRPLFVDEQGRLTPEAVNPATGVAREPAYSGAPSPLAAGATGAASTLLGPWGAAAGAGIGLFASVYAALRGKRRIDAERAKSAAWQGGMTLLVGVIEDIKNGRIDADRNGKVSLKEIAAYVSKRGRDAINPDFVAEVVRIVNSTLPEADKSAALAKLA
ncbi:MAG: hypothetical protein IT462_05815 [Planctomycetes bacterium]|nr:hypothetical protein [Planctomycetota bacterium]